MFKFDIEAVNQLARAIEALPEQVVRATAVGQYLETVMEAKPGEDASFMDKLSLSFRSGPSATIEKKEKGVVTTPNDIPVVIRIARQMARESGRAPRIRIRTPGAAGMLAGWRETGINKV